MCKAQPISVKYLLYKFLTFSGSWVKMIYSSKFFFEKCHDCNCRLNYKNRPSNDISSMIFLVSGNFRCQNFFLQKFWFEKYVWTNFRIITKNSVADPAIGFNVVVRPFLKEKRDVSRRVWTQARRAFAPWTLTTKPALLMGRCDVRYINIYWSRKIGFRKWNFFGVKEFFLWTLISKIGVKTNLRIITKNHAAHPEIGFLTKSI